MTKIYRIFHRVFIIAVVALIDVACTQNDGDIGDLFGVWRLTQLTADGTPLPLYEGDDAPVAYDWAFQGDVIKIVVVEHHQDYYSSFGMWSREDGRLLLDFSYGGNEISEFDPPASLHLVEVGVTPLEMTVMTSKKMVGWYVDENGVKYEYTLKKLY